MRKKMIPLIVLLGAINGYAQTGIGTSLPNATAELEITSSDKGVLIPRVVLTSETDISTIKGGEYPESLLVYHKGIPGLEAGFYFWANKKWNALVSNSTLYKYIKETAKEGDVTITHTGGDNFSFTWIDKSTGNQTTINMEDLIKKMETITTLSKGTDPKKATLVYKNEDKTNPITEIDLTQLLKGSSEFNEFLTKFVSTASISETETTIEPILNGTKKTGVYKYYNEKRNTDNYKPVEITVVDDVKNNFGDIINNEDVKKVLNQFFTTNPPAGTVTYVFENNKHIFKYIDKDGKAHDLDMNQLVKDYETNTTLTEVVSGNAGKYVYKNEKGDSAFIDVVKGVIDNSKTIFETKTIVEKIVEQIKENAQPGTVTVKEVAGNFEFSWKDATGATHSMNMDAIVKKFETLTIASLKDTGNKDVIFNYKDEKGVTVELDFTKALGNSEVFKTFLKGYISTESIKETITTLISDNKGTYTYKNEEGTNYKITVVDDVKNNFGDIINNEDVKKVLNQFFTTNPPAGTVTYVFENNKHIFKYIDKDGKAHDLDMNQLVKDYETKTLLSKFDAKGILVDNKVVPKNGFTYYKYDSESPETRYISVSQDVSNDFKTILEQGDNKTYIKNIAESVNNYSTTKEEIIGKWDDKDIIRYTVKLTQANAFTSIELPKVIGGLIIDAKLINESTNSLVRGVISKQVSGTKTILAIGTSGTIITNNPSGAYYVIVEYVKQ
ncbi:hypothetical protein LNQ81_13110 [Myroides sp. M-43]|uniref:hypothetical protein n=1 Tax=Myroides oncorhynchi TaxID=2893756 RepID=UPI001E2A93FB|nr:hypothetical protein [Myroides oncorhynchi]MCC9043613.1 hypothetical protein [Myroides oncorhynchi]